MAGIIMSLKAQNMDRNLNKHMQKLMQLGCSGDMWSCNSLVSELVLVHFVRLEDPDTWAQAGRGDSYVQTVQVLTDILETNPTICELLETLWSNHFDIAAYINSAAFQVMLTNLPSVHSKFIMGCGKYLSAVLQPGWSMHLETDARFLKVQAAIATYLGAVQNLPLDAGHWHELWVAGDEVAVCLIDHFLHHEDQSDERWNTEHVRNPAKYLNRNLQNLRDLVAGNTEVCEMLSTLRAVRPDIWAFIDGRAMQRIATCLRGAELLLGCANFLSTSLGSNWQEGRINPRAEVQRCIDAYVNNMFRLYGQQSEGRISPAWQPAPGYVSPASTPRPNASGRFFHDHGTFPSRPSTSHSTASAPALSTSYPGTSQTPRFSAHNPNVHSAGTQRFPAARPTLNARQAIRHSLTPNAMPFNNTISPRQVSSTGRHSAPQIPYIPMSSPNGPSFSPQPLTLATPPHHDLYPESPLSGSSPQTAGSPASSYMHTAGPFSPRLSCPASPSSSAGSHRASGSEILDMWQMQQAPGSKRSIWSPSNPMAGQVAGVESETAAQAQEWSDMLNSLWENPAVMLQPGY